LNIVVGQLWFKTRQSRIEQSGLITTIRPLQITAYGCVSFSLEYNDINERMAVATHEAWSVPGTAEQPLAPNNARPMLTKEMIDGQTDVSDANAKMVKEFSEEYNLQTPKR
jgi:hypothetical protein